MRALTSVLTCALGVACGSPAQPEDGGVVSGDHDAGGQTAMDGSLPLQDSGSSGADAGRIMPLSDGAVDGPHPPAGAVRCGMGVVSNAELGAACTALDPIRDLSVGGETDCNAFVSSGIQYEIWCTDTSVHLWLWAGSLDDPMKKVCRGSVPLPDAGVFMHETRFMRWDYLTEGNELLFTDTSDGRFQISGSPDVLFNTSSAALGGEEEPWTMRIEQTFDVRFAPAAGGSGLIAVRTAQVDCDDFPVPDSSRFVLVIPFEWGSD